MNYSYPSPTLERGAGPKLVAGLVAVMVIILLAGLVILYKTRKDAPLSNNNQALTSAGRRPILPPLNTTGSENPDNPLTQQLAGLKDTDKLFNDLTPSMGRAKIEQIVNERLHLTQNDQDYDGLSNAAEVLIYGTNPRYFDTDVDGTSDNNEIQKGSDPLVAGRIWSDADKKTVQDRINYWGTNFALDVATQNNSQQDMTRIAYAGQIRVLLSEYYNDNKTYPIATTWEQAWSQLKAKDAGKMFSSGNKDESWKNGMFDPVNTAPFVFTYTTNDQGKSYTFTYALETSKAMLTIHDSNGEEGSVTRTPLLNNTTTVASPVSQAPAFIPEAKAAGIPSFVNQAVYFTARTRDGVLVTSYGSDFWSNYASGHTLAQTKLKFKLAIKAYNAEGIDGGYCDNIGCYCANGTSFMWGGPPPPPPPVVVVPVPTAVVIIPATPVPVPAPNAIISSINSACFNSRVSLDGSRSQNATAYQWKVLEPSLQPESSLSGANNQSAQFTASKEGTYLISLTASNSAGATSTANTSVYVMNHAPDVQVNVPAGVVNDPITVTATATDPDAATCQDTVASYSWTLTYKGSPVPFTYSNNQQSITFTPKQPGTYTGVVTVTDNHGKSLPKQVQIPIGVPPFNPDNLRETTAP